MADKKELAGPPAPRSKYDNLPREMRPEDERVVPGVDLVDALLALSQVADLVQTERGLAIPGGYLNQEEKAERGLPEDPSAYWKMHEANPLPGMQSLEGRIAWGSAEHKGLEELRKRKPGIGVPLTLAAALTHLFLAGRWQHQINHRPSGDFSEDR